MKYMTAEELYNKFKGKPYVEWMDLVRLIEDEFQISLVVEETPNEDEIQEIAEDEEILRQIRMSQQDRQNGHVYGQEDGLKYLRDRIIGTDRG